MIMINKFQEKMQRIQHDR